MPSTATTSKNAARKSCAGQRGDQHPQSPATLAHPTTGTPINASPAKSSTNNPQPPKSIDKTPPNNTHDLEKHNPDISDNCLLIVTRRIGRPSFSTPGCCRATTTTMVRVRQKKINPKSNLPILREADTANFDPDDVERGIDAYTGLPKIESGVESKEEKVCHVTLSLSVVLHRELVPGFVVAASSVFIEQDTLLTSLVAFRSTIFKPSSRRPMLQLVITRPRYPSRLQRLSKVTSSMIDSSQSNLRNLQRTFASRQQWKTAWASCTA